MYFKGPIWSTKVHKVLQSETKKRVDFSVSLKMSPLKHIRFFKVREKQDRRYSDPKARNG